jgi:hypothetical protein
MLPMHLIVVEGFAAKRVMVVVHARHTGQRMVCAHFARMRGAVAVKGGASRAGRGSAPTQSATARVPAAASAPGMTAAAPAAT